MNAKKLFFYVCSSLIFALPLSAQAVIIDGTFKAKVAGAEPEEGLWGDIMGETITGTFSYDTALFEIRSLAEPNEARYFNYSNTFVNMTFNIAGNSFDISRDYTDTLTADSQTDMVIVQDSDPRVPGGDYDYFMLLDSVYLGDVGSDYVQTTGDIYIFDWIADFTKGTDLEQQFNWVSPSEDTPGGYGNFSYHYNFDGNSLYAFVNMHITEVTASVRESSVPEPASFWLLITALFGFALRFRQHQIF